MVGRTNRDDWLEQAEKENKPIGFAISDVPVPFYRWFISDVDDVYGGSYSKKLQDLMRKAEAYDFLLSQGNIPITEESPSESISGPQGTSKVMTFGGLQGEDEIR